MPTNQPDADRDAIREIILREFLPDEDPRELTDDTALITNSVLDSLAILTLVGLLERKFDIRIEPHETDVERMNTIAQMSELVKSKRGGRKA